MKIIGDAESNLIVMISKDELARFMGFYSEYCTKEKGIILKPGTFVDVGQCYEEAKQVLDLHESAQSAAKTLKNTATKFLNFFEKPK